MKMNENSFNVTSSPIASSTFRRNATKLLQDTTINLHDDDNEHTKYELTLLRKEIDDILRNRRNTRLGRLEGRKSSLQLLQLNEIDDDFNMKENENRTVMESSTIRNLNFQKQSILAENRFNKFSTPDNKKGMFTIRDDNTKISLAPDFDEDIQELQNDKTLTNSQIKEKSRIIDNSVNNILFQVPRRTSIEEFFCSRTPDFDELGITKETNDGISKILFLNEDNNEQFCNDENKLSSNDNNINRLSLHFNEDNVDFGVIAQYAIKKVWLTLKNSESINVSLQLSIKDNHNYFTFTPINFDDKRNANVIHRKIMAKSEMTIIVQLKCDDNFSDDLKSMNVTAQIVASYEGSQNNLAIANLFGKIAFTRIEFQITQFPLTIPFGEKTYLMFKNNGILLTEFDILLSECNSCNENIFSVYPKKISLVPEEVGGIYITFDLAPSHCTDRYVILRDPNGFTCSCSLKGLIDGQEFSTFTTNENSEKLSSAGLTMEKHSALKSTSSIKSDNEYFFSGKLPIETTKNYLVWECIKVNTSDLKNFLIRNKSEHKIKFRIFIKSTEFKLIREGQCMSFDENQITAKLNCHESLCVKVAFTPTIIGSCIGKICFQSYYSNTYEKSILLFGYGGHTSIGFQRVLKDGHERMWLDVGSLDPNRLNILQIISLYNHGTLPLVTIMNINKKQSLTMVNAKMEIIPSIYVIESEKKMDFKVKITFSKDDVKQLYTRKEPIIELGVLTVQYMAEPTLHRLKKLYERFPELALSKIEIIEKWKEISGNEISIDFSDPKQSIKYLSTFLRTKEITITIEKQNIDDFDTENDTCLFYSLLTDITTQVD